MARVTKKKSLVIEVPEDSPVPVTSTDSKRRRPSPSVSVLGFLLLLALGTAYYFYYQYTHTAEVRERQEIEALVNVVGKMIELPSEFPTLATVTNKEKLDDQPFFKRAQNGDKILIFSENGRAVLYRPESKKIIDVTTVDIVDEQGTDPGVPVAEVSQPEAVPAPVAEPAPEEPVVEAEAVEVTESVASVALYNGSAKVGVTNSFETKLTGEYSALTVVAKEKAVNNDYTGVLIVDLSGNQQALVTALAETYAGTVGPLPEGETAPANADILIIVGN